MNRQQALSRKVADCLRNSSVQQILLIIVKMNIAWPNRCFRETWVIVAIWPARCANTFEQSTATDVEINVTAFIVKHEYCVWVSPRMTASLRIPTRHLRHLHHLRRAGQLAGDREHRGPAALRATNDGHQGPLDRSHDRGLDPAGEQAPAPCDPDLQFKLSPLSHDGLCPGPRSALR